MSAARAYAEAAADQAANDRSDTWAPPQPIASKSAPMPYPVDALPEMIRAAITEVQGFVQSPVAMVASSALGVASVACQGLVDIRRTEGLSGPVSLSLLGIADSGERKTSGDGHFKRPLTEYERERLEFTSPQIENHKADSAIWKSKQEALHEKLKANIKTGKDTKVIEADLRDLEMNKPTKPRVPCIVRTDDTPENLAYSLMHEWPSAGVMSSEAGLVFGGHAMGENSIMRNLSLLNLLWDGGEHNIGRRTSASFKLHGARLSVSLQVQEATLRDFFGRSGNLARGIGFFARFLIYWPESTQGTRWFREAPISWPALSEFNRLVRSILDSPLFRSKPPPSGGKGF
ncbi:MAG: YfjI family protein, partial [Rhodospirillaceae bacterium]